MSQQQSPSGAATPTLNRSSSISGYVPGQNASHLSPSFQGPDQYHVAPTDQFAAQRTSAAAHDISSYSQQPPGTFGDEQQEHHGGGRRRSQQHYQRPGSSRSQPHPRVQMPAHHHQQEYDASGPMTADPYLYHQSSANYHEAAHFTEPQLHSEPATPMQHIIPQDQPPLNVAYGQQQPLRKYERMMSMPMGSQSDSAPGSVQSSLSVGGHRPTSASSMPGRRSHASSGSGAAVAGDQQVSLKAL